MLAVLSPAKTLLEEPLPGKDFSCPNLLDDTRRLVSRLQKFSVKRLCKLMGVSEAIGTLNHFRYQNFELPFTEENSAPAILSFQGEVYQHIKTQEFENSDFQFAQEHLRILSGLYGLLRPLDRIYPYRLEMGTRLSNTRGKDLYKFWGNRITNALAKDLEDHEERVVINLASQEYFRSVRVEKLGCPVINIHFKEQRGGKASVIGFLAKRARGMMADHIIRNQIDRSEDLRDFCEGGYRFEHELSSATDWVYLNG